MNARRARGVALIAALLVVALAVVLVAALLDRGEALRARSRNTLRAEQGWQLMHGLEGWAAAALRQDWVSRDFKTQGIRLHKSGITGKLWAIPGRIPATTLQGVKVVAAAKRERDGSPQLRRPLAARAGAWDASARGLKVMAADP